MAVFNDAASSGSNTYNGLAGADTFVFRTASTNTLAVAGNRTGTVSGFETITNFETGTAATSDRIKFVTTAGSTGNSVAVAATITGTARSTLRTSDGKEIRSHSVSNGVISFSGSGAFDQATPLTSNADVAAAVQYLRLLDLGNAGATVAFTANINGVAHTFIFIQGTNAGTDAQGNVAQDVLIDVVGKAATSLDFNANGIAIVEAPANAGPPTIQQPDLAAGLSFWGNDNTFPVEVSTLWRSSSERPARHPPPPAAQKPAPRWPSSPIVASRCSSSTTSASKPSPGPKPRAV